MKDAPGTPKVLLLIDDDQDDREIFQEALKVVDREIVCHTAEDGKDGLSKLYRAPALPDLVFLDLNMPVMDGKECLKAMKADRKLRDIPVIVYSTSSTEKERRSCLSLGASHFISKPAQFSKLVEELKDTLYRDWAA